MASEKQTTSWEGDFEKSSKKKQRFVEPFIARRTPFQHPGLEIFDTFLGFCTCLLLIISAFLAKSDDFFYWKDTGANPTVWPKTSDTDVVPEGAVDDAKKKLEETFDASRLKRAFLMARNIVGAGRAHSITETLVTPRFKWLTPLAILAAFGLALFFAWAFGRGARAYAAANRPPAIYDDIPARKAFFKKSWQYARWVPCVPTLFVCLYWLYLFCKIQRMKYVIGNALWVAVAAFVFNLAWLFMRSLRIWMVYRWTKAKSTE